MGPCETRGSQNDKSPLKHSQTQPNKWHQVPLFLIHNKPLFQAVLPLLPGENNNSAEKCLRYFTTLVEFGWSSASSSLTLGC